MDSLTAFGLSSVTAMLVFYALEDRSPSYILAFAGACALASIYGFMQGAWPFGVVEAIWAASVLIPKFVSSCGGFNYELRNRRTLATLLNLVWLWFRSPHIGLAVRMMRTSEPPH